MSFRFVWLSVLPQPRDFVSTGQGCLFVEQFIVSKSSLRAHRLWVTCACTSRRIIIICSSEPVTCEQYYCRVYNFYMEPIYTAHFPDFQIYTDNNDQVILKLAKNRTIWSCTLIFIRASDSRRLQKHNNLLKIHFMVIFQWTVCAKTPRVQLQGGKR